MRNPFPFESRIVRQLWGTFIARFPSSWGHEVIHYDPAAARPHDLDDPFFDPEVQKRVANIIAGAARERPEDA